MVDQTLDEIQTKYYYNDYKVRRKKDVCEEQKLHDFEYITQGQIDNLKKELMKKEQ